MAHSDQVPVQSGFHARSTGTEVLSDIDLTGKTAIVTGGYSGIGLETVRSPDKAVENLAGVQGDVGTAHMELADFASVRRFADAMRGAHSRLDLVINNAGPTDPESAMARYMGVEAHACSDEAAERLWTMSEKLLDAA